MSKPSEPTSKNSTELDEQLERTKRDLAKLKRVKNLLDRVKPGGIRLLEAHCKLGKLLPERLPDNARQETNLTTRVEERNEAIQVIATYGLSVSYDPLDKIDESSPIFVRGRFLVEYPCDSDTATKRLAQTIKPNAVKDSWPYWRE